MISEYRFILLFLQLIILAGIIGCKQHSIEDTPNYVSDKTSISREIEEADVEVNELRNLYFGDLHVHTRLSVDAYVLGTLTTADEAYSFAQGQTIKKMNTNVKLIRPLDFCAVTDHAEALGEMFTVQTPGVEGYNSFFSKMIRSIYDPETESGIDSAKQQRIVDWGSKRLRKGKELYHSVLFKGYETTKSAWMINLEAADKHYKPAEFTTFAGYEWTWGGGAKHMHRNLIFRDMIVPDYPMSAIELTSEEELWHWLTDISDSGATVLAIPHNSNLSDGGTFPDLDSKGQPLDSAYAQLRQNFEPLIEVHQEKGNSEVHAPFWKNDEFAGFENLPHSHRTKKNNYVRNALKRGLEHEEHIGINPFKYGMIGSTDNHEGLPGNTEENNYGAEGSEAWNKAKKRRNDGWELDPEIKVYRIQNPGGLVAVWAKANTRGYIYDALKRRECYATSGNRIQLRFFGGSGFKGNYKTHEQMLADGYDKGSPMGSDIVLKEGQIPEFLVWAKKDTAWAALDRIQIIKGWFAHGQLHEKVFNVAVSDGRILNEDGSVADNGANVDLETGKHSEDKGDTELSVVWKDPDFDKDSRAFYYVRVLEIPTASWRLWDKIRFGIEYPDDAELTVRERAWSSPIWYVPPVGQ